MYESISLFLSQLISFLTRFVIYIAVQYNLCSVALGAVHLDERRCGRHHYDCLGAKAFCRIGHALGMIACRCGYKTFCAHLFRKRTDLVICASNLVSAGKLHVFRL